MDRIRIAYGGTLKHATDLNTNQPLSKQLMEWFWTYHRNRIYSKSRSALPIFRAIQTLNEEERENILVHLWGNINPGNKDLASEMKIESSVLIESFKSKTETRSLLASADLLYLPLEMNSKNQQSPFLPGKLFEYLSFRKPILCFSEDCEAKRIVLESGLGVVFNPRDHKGCADFLRETILSEKSNFARFEANVDFIETFSFKNKVVQLEQLIQNL